MSNDRRMSWTPAPRDDTPDAPPTALARSREPALPAPAAAAPSAPPRAAATDDIDLAQLLRILRRRWPWLIGTMAVIGVATWRYYGTLPPVYQARTTLLLPQAQQTIVGLAMGAANQPDNRLATEIEIIRSRTIALEVADAVQYNVRVATPERLTRVRLLEAVTTSPKTAAGVYTFEPQGGGRVLVLGPNRVTDTARVGIPAEVEGFGFILRPAAGTAPFTMAVSTVDESAGALQGATSVAPVGRDASVLAVSVSSTDPGLAQLAADAYASSFIARQTAQRRAGGISTLAFIREQLAIVNAQLADAEGNVRSWRERNRVVRPEDEAGTGVSRRASYETQLAQLQEEIRLLETLSNGTAQMSPAMRAMPGYRRVLTAPIFASNQVGSTILSTILRLEGERTALQGRRNAEDPELRLIERTLADYESQAEQFLENYLATRRVEVQSYKRLLGDVGAALLTVPGLELELKTLERDVEVLSSLQLVLQQRLKEGEITNAAEIPTVQVLDGARMPGAPVSPRASLYLALGAVAAVVGGAGAAIGRDLLDRTMHTADALEAAAGVPVLAVIPAFSMRARGRGRRSTRAASSDRRLAGRDGSVAVKADLITVREPRHLSAEAYRVLRANLRVGAGSIPARVIAMGSASPGDGKSTTVANLAAALAMQGERVLLIDADMRRSTLHTVTGVPRGPGLSEKLAGAPELLFDLACEVPLAPGTSLHLLRAGRSPENPTELLGSAAWARLIEEARATFDAVLVDTPPVNMFADSLLAASVTDGFLLVARAGRSQADEVRMAAAQLRALRIPLLGAVLNDFHVHRDGRYGNYQYYRKYYGRYYEHYGQTAGQA